jgi:hypothetical protein
MFPISPLNRQNRMSGSVGQPDFDAKVRGERLPRSPGRQEGPRPHAPSCVSLVWSSHAAATGKHHAAEGAGGGAATGAGRAAGLTLDWINLGRSHGLDADLHRRLAAAEDGKAA